MHFLGALFLLFSWLVAEHFPPWVSWHGEAVAFLGVVLVCWSSLLGRSSVRSSREIDVPVVAWPFLALAAIGLLQMASGRLRYLGDMLTLAFYMFLCVACLCLGFASESSRKPDAKGRDDAVIWLAAILVLGGVLSTSIALLQVFDLMEGVTWIVRPLGPSRPGGNLAQPNQLATLLVMGMASVAFLVASSRLSGRSSVVILLFLGLGAAVSESRSGALAVGLLLVWWSIRREKIAAPIPRAKAWVLGGAFIFMFLAWPSVLNALLLLDPQAQNRTLAGSSRFLVWPQLLEALQQRWWLGWGIRQTAEALNSVAHAFRVSEAFTYSHNVLLDFALWMGVPISLLLIVPSCVWAWRRVSAVKQLRAWYCLAVAAPMMVHSMFEFPFTYAYLLVPVVFLVGVLEATATARPWFHLKRSPAMIILGLFSALLAWSAAEYLAIEEDFRIARFEALRIGHISSDYRPPDVILLTQLGALLRATRAIPKRDMPADQMDLLRDVALHYPWPAMQYRYILALAVNGQAEEAVRQILVLRAQHGEKLYQRIKRDLTERADNGIAELGNLRLP